MKVKKRLIAIGLVFCLISALCVTASAINWAQSSRLTIKYHYVPVLKDSATAVPGTPGGSYDHGTLYSKTTVTAYNSDSSVSKTTNCNNVMYVHEGWSNYTQAVASIRSIKSAAAVFTIGSKDGSITQRASIYK